MAEVNEKVLTGEGLAELWKLIKAEDAKDAKVATGSLVGNGSYATLTFNFVPKLVVVQSPNSHLFAVMTYGATKALANHDNGNSEVTVTWHDTSVTWGGALVYADEYYNYVAIG